MNKIGRHDIIPDNMHMEMPVEYRQYSTMAVRFKVIDQLSAKVGDLISRDITDRIIKTVFRDDEVIIFSDLP